MARRKIYIRGSVSSATQDEAFVWSVRGIDNVSVLAKSIDGAWNGSLVLTLEVSQNGYDWFNASYIDEADGTGTDVPTFTSTATTQRKRMVPCFEMPIMRLRVSTTGGTTSVEITIYGEGEELPVEGSDMDSPYGAGIAAPGGPSGGGSFSGGSAGSGDGGGSSSTGNGGGIGFN